MTLKPLDVAFGIQYVITTSMQACSGAGGSPGVAALDIMDNLVPYIPKEEEKVDACTRVPVLAAHTEAVYVSLKKAATVDDMKRVLREYGTEFPSRGWTATARAAC